MCLLTRSALFEYLCYGSTNIKDILTLSVRDRLYTSESAHHTSITMSNIFCLFIEKGKQYTIILAQFLKLQAGPVFWYKLRYVVSCTRIRTQKIRKKLRKYDILRRLTLPLPTSP